MNFDQDLDDELGEMYADADWKFDTPDSGYTDEYNAFLRNGCIGILTEEEAVRKSKLFSGMDPETAEPSPGVQWLINERREWLESLGSGFSKEEQDEYLSERYPFEPLLRYQF